MREDLERLINETVTLEERFHSIPVSSLYDGPRMQYIFDVPEFIQWITKVRYELIDIFSRTNDSFIFSLNNPNGIVNKFDGKHHNEKRMFIELKTALQQILEHSSKYYPQENVIKRANENSIYLSFLKVLLSQENAIIFLESLYDKEELYSSQELNEILGFLKEERLINGYYADNRFILTGITLRGKHYFDNVTMEAEIDNSMNNLKNNSKKPKIFISHNTKDKQYVEALVDLFASIGLTTEQIFCSSLPGYGIPVDEDIFEYLRNHFMTYDLHVIIIHSSNYYQSPVSLNEMGAAWALRKRHTSILLPGFDFSEMKGVIGSNTIGIKLDNDEYELKDKLNQLKDSLVVEFGLPIPNSTVWEKNRDSFINAVQK